MASAGASITTVRRSGSWTQRSPSWATGATTRSAGRRRCPRTRRCAAHHVVQHLVAAAQAVGIAGGGVVLPVDPVRDQHRRGHQQLQHAAVRVLAGVVVVQEAAARQHRAVAAPARRDQTPALPASPIRAGSGRRRGAAAAAGPAAGHAAPWGPAQARGARAEPGRPPARAPAAVCSIGPRRGRQVEVKALDFVRGGVVQRPPQTMWWPGWMPRPQTRAHGTRSATGQAAGIDLAGLAAAGAAVQCRGVRCCSTGCHAPPAAPAAPGPVPGPWPAAPAPPARRRLRCPAR